MKKLKTKPIRDLLPHGAITRVAAKNDNMTVQNVSLIAKGLVRNEKVYAELLDEINIHAEKELKREQGVNLLTTLFKDLKAV